MAIIAYFISIIDVEIPTALLVIDKIGIVSYDVITNVLSTIGNNLDKIIMFIIQLLKPQTNISGRLIIDDVIVFISYIFIEYMRIAHRFETIRIYRKVPHSLKY